MLVTLYKICGVHFRLLGTIGFHVKAKKKRFTVASSRCRQKFHVVVWQTTSKHCTKKRAARASSLFFFIQPIKSLICGVVVPVAVVISLTPSVILLMMKNFRRGRHPEYRKIHEQTRLGQSESRLSGRRERNHLTHLIGDSETISQVDPERF